MLTQNIKKEQTEQMNSNSLTSNFSPQLPLSSYFEKFKHGTAELTSAFKLFTPPSESNSDDSSSGEMGNERKNRGSYRKYTLEEKQEAVRKIQEGYDVKQISKQYSIPRRNLLRWKKNGCERKEGGGRPTDNQMEFILYAKIKDKTLKTEKQIRNEAKKLSKSESFKASKGWYCKFCRRYNLWNANSQNSSKMINQNQDPSSISADQS